MKVKIIKDIKIAISPRENKQFNLGESHEVTEMVAKRLLELKCCEVIDDVTEIKKVIEDIPVKKRGRKPKQK